jgi:acyl-CoA thioesterase YciA
VAVNEFVFKQAVSVGDLLSFYSRVTRVGNTSVSVHVEVYAERNPANPQVVRVTDAKLTYVAIDREGRSRPIPSDAKEPAGALKSKDPEDSKD